MAIESLDDLNARLAACGCCLMPACPVPEVECQSRFVAIDVCGESFACAPGTVGSENCETANKTYREIVVTCSASRTETYSRTTGGGNYTRTYSSSYTETRTYEWRDVEEGIGRECFAKTVISASMDEVFTQEETDLGLPDGSLMKEERHGTREYDSSDPDLEGSGCESSYHAEYKNGDDVDTTGTTCPGCDVVGPPCSAEFVSGSTLSDSGSDTEDNEPGNPDVSHHTTTTYSKSIAYGNPLTWPDFYAEAEIRFELNPYDGEDSEIGSACSAIRIRVMGACPEDPESEPVPNENTPYSMSEQRFRYRFKIPSTHTGPVFYLRWDLVHFPEGYDPEDPSSPQPTLTPQSYDWSGPGNPADANDPSWFTPWSDEVTFDEGGGTIEVRNLRFTCYKGGAPQYAGARFIPLPEE